MSTNYKAEDYLREALQWLGPDGSEQNSSSPYWKQGYNLAYAGKWQEGRR